MRSCLLCKKKNIPGNGTFFSVPLDEDKRARWQNICQKEFRTTTRICIDHFSKNDIVNTGRRVCLLPNADPIVKRKKNFTRVPCPVQYQTKGTSVKNLRLFSVAEITTSAVSKFPGRSFKDSEWQAEPNDSRTNENFPPNSSSNIDCNVANGRFSAQNNFRQTDNHTQAFGQNLTHRNTNLNIIPPQLDEPIVDVLPAVKLISCSGSAQTNTRFCGLVEASDFADEFRFNCFYCSHVFPIEQWKDFIEHLKECHFSEEEAFQTSKYLSQEHDYTPLTLAKTEPIVYNCEIANNDNLVDPLQNPFETVHLNPNLYLSPFVRKSQTNFVTFRQKSKMGKYKNKKNPKRVQISSSRLYSKHSSQQIPKISALSRCLKRTADEAQYIPEMEENAESYHINNFDSGNVDSDALPIDPENPTEIAFEFSPRAVVNLLLDSMKKYTVLWQHDEQPFNEDFFEAAEELCNIVNSQFALNIDNLKMRRSINRILRFYCHVFPNENNHQFTYYYNKCAEFLPSVNEIAYARCSHCYLCFQSDFDLQLHLVEEQKYLTWPFKCPQCKECFRLWTEYQFHKHLPHYDEIFRCQECKLSFFRRLAYKKHMVDEHQSITAPGKFKCHICDKTVETSSGLKTHIKYHGERQHKCHLCPKSFHEKSKLVHHLQIHRKETNFMCEVCGKKFYRQPALNIHMTKHTGEKVTCKICGLRLRKSSLGRHLRIVHVPHSGPLRPTIEKFFKNRGREVCIAKLLQSLPKRLAKTRTKTGLPREYNCKICKLTFDKYKEIVEHNKELHSDNTRWPCKICPSEFSHKVNLKNHYRKKHKLHGLQVFKLVEENDNIDDVLAIKPEEIEELCEKLRPSNANSLNITIAANETPVKNIIESDGELSSPIDPIATKSDNESPTKTDLLPDEIFYSEEKFHSSTIQDEIMKAVDEIETEDIKIDYIDDMLTDYLQ